MSPNHSQPGAGADQSSWRRPRGVAQGTWRYVHEGTIAARYNEFVAATPLCRIDLAMLAEVFPNTYRRDGNPQGQHRAVGITSREHSAEPQNDSQKKWVLDLGCGTGRASEVLSAHGYDVLAVDLSLPMLGQVASRGLESVHTVQANLVELDCFRDAFACGAVCLFSTLGMIQGRENRRQFLSHVRRIVCPGGPFLLHTHHRYAALTTLPGMKQLATTTFRSVIRKDWELGDAVYSYRGLPDMFLHQFSRRELLADFAETKWRVRQWENLSINGEAVVDERWKIAGGFLVVLE